MQVNVRPEATAFDGLIYTITLWGTALLDGQAWGWFKSRAVWWSAKPAPGMAIVLQIPRDPYETAPGTSFEAAVYWAKSAPGKGRALWSGKYRVRDTPEGPVLDEAE